MIAKLKANKLLALLLCLVMVMGLLPTMALADETVGKVDEAPTESEVETGGLKIELFVTGAGADESKEFEISVSLKDSDGAAVSGTFGDYTFIDGVTTVYLSHLNSVVFTGIPGGTISTVTPTDVDNYTVEAHGSGLIRKNTTGIILVAADYIGPIEVETGSLTVSKTVSGSVDDRYKAFPFTVYVYNGDSPLEGTYGDMVLDEEGKATFTLTDGQSVKAAGLPVGCSYYVEETDSDGYTVTAQVNGEPYDVGEEVGIEGIIESDNLDVVVEFNNYKSGGGTVIPTPEPEYGNVKITKTVKGDKAPTDGIAYEFTAWVETSDRNAVSEVVSYRKTAADGTTSSGGVTIGKDGYTFSLKDGESIVFDSITSGRLVEVKEIVTGDFTTTSSGLTDDVCVISTDSTQMVEFVNDYGDADTPDEPTPPTTPDEPDEPTSPTTPDEPDEPTSPTTPDEPDEPTSPTTPDEPDETTTPTTSAKQLNNVPKTGDESSVGFWIALALLSLVGIVALAVGRKHFDARQRK